LAFSLFIFVVFFACFSINFFRWLSL
jgi:hypothetical protein